MNIQYTTCWAKEPVRYGDKYTAWLKSLRKWDEVLLQEFYPASNSSLDFPFERWSFERYKVTGYEDEINIASPLRGSGVKPLDIKTGKCKYYDSDSDWGNVFPARIVPISSDMNPLPGETIFGHQPIYCPEYSEATRYITLVTRGPSMGRQEAALYNYPHRYYQEVDQGKLYFIFTDEEPDFDYLYSKPTER